MADRLFALEGPKELKAITVNGAVIVESEEERQRLVLAEMQLIIKRTTNICRKKEERAKKRKSRWDNGSTSKMEKHK